MPTRGWEQRHSVLLCTGCIHVMAGTRALERKPAMMLREASEHRSGKTSTEGYVGAYSYSLGVGEEASEESEVGVGVGACVRACEGVSQLGGRKRGGSVKKGVKVGREDAMWDLDRVSTQTHTHTHNNTPVLHHSLSLNEP